MSKEFSQDTYNQAVLEYLNANCPDAMKYAEVKPDEEESGLIITFHSDDPTKDDLVLLNNDELTVCYKNNHIHINHFFMKNESQKFEKLTGYINTWLDLEEQLTHKELTDKVIDWIKSKYPEIKIIVKEKNHLGIEYVYIHLNSEENNSVDIKIATTHNGMVIYYDKYIEVLSNNNQPNYKSFFGGVSAIEVFDNFTTIFDDIITEGVKIVVGYTNSSMCYARKYPSNMEVKIDNCERVEIMSWKGTYTKTLNKA